MNIAISTLKELETFLVERFRGRPFERRESPGDFTSFCEDVDGCGWCAELSVRTDVKRDVFVAKSLFRRQTFQSNARVNIPVEGELLDDMYVIVTSPSLNSLVSRLGVKSRMMDLRSLTEETHLNLPTGCVLVITPPPESGKKVAEDIFNKHAINHVAFVSSDGNENLELSELKTLIVHIAKDLEKRQLEEKKIEALSLDERTARFHAQLASDLRVTCVFFHSLILLLSASDRLQNTCRRTPSATERRSEGCPACMSDSRLKRLRRRRFRARPTAADG